MSALGAVVLIGCPSGVRKWRPVIAMPGALERRISGDRAVARRLLLPLADCFAVGRLPWSLADRRGVRGSLGRSCGER